KASGEAAKAGINDSIRVRLEKLAEAKGVDKNKLVLFLGGLQIKGLYGQGVDTDSNVLEYKLTRDGSSSDAKAAWTNLLGSPTAYSKPVTVSIGIENGRPVAPTDPEHPPMFTLIILHRGWFWFTTLAFLAVLILFWYLAKNTNILRDSGPPQPPEGQRRPYSLGRVQMAFWFFLVVGSFIYLYLIVNDYNTLTEQALILIGIGTGTALGSAAIDANKRSTSDSQLIDLQPAKAKLEAEIGDLQAKQNQLQAKIAAAPPGAPGDQTALSAANVDLATKQAQLEETNKQIKIANEGLSKPVSEGLLRDLLTEASGISFHRFQMLIWTIVLGFLFVVGVYKALAMPSFSNTLL